MKVNQKDNKVKLEDLEFGKTFKLIGNINHFMKLDLSEEIAFKDIDLNNVEVCADLLTGKAILLDLSVVVECINLEAREV